MGEEVFQSQVSSALLTVLVMSAPALGAAIVVGVGVGLIQALTQIQDQTLPQAVKLVVVLVVLILTGPLLGAQVTELARQGLEQFPLATR
jgi:type III secretion protein S